MKLQKSPRVVEACSFIKKRPWQMCFPVNFTKFLRTSFLTEQLWWLLLKLPYRKLVFYSFIFPEMNYRNNVYINDIKKIKVLRALRRAYTIKFFFGQAYTIKFFFHTWVNFSFDGFLLIFNTCIQLRNVNEIFQTTIMKIFQKKKILTDF